MIWLILAVLVSALVFGPSFWVRRVMARHGGDRPDLPGTGGELARHLLDRFGLEAVEVADSDGPDCYDPTTRAVRLNHQHYGGRSITAVAVAAHEVGHAFQHAENYPPFLRRAGIVRTAQVTDTVGSGVLFTLSLVGGVATSPRLILLGLVAVGLMGLARVAASIANLPTEHDASFGRALPILARDGYLTGEDLVAARSVLRAASYTYVAQALAQLINLFRFLRR